MDNKKCCCCCCCCYCSPSSSSSAPVFSCTHFLSSFPPSAPTASEHTQRPLLSKIHASFFALSFFLILFSLFLLFYFKKLNRVFFVVLFCRLFSPYLTRPLLSFEIHTLVSLFLPPFFGFWCFYFMKVSTFYFVLFCLYSLYQ